MNFTPMKIPVITNVTGDYIDEYEKYQRNFKASGYEFS